MIFKNLYRRKARTTLTILGIAIGVAAIIALGVMASMLEDGFTSMMTGSKSDLLLSQPDTFSLSYSAVDEKIVDALAAMPEVARVSGMVQDIIQTPENPFFFIFGYPAHSYILERYQIVAGYGLDSPEADRARGKPLLLGIAAAEALEKEPGDTLLLGDSLFRITGIFQTGDAFEDRGAVTQLVEAQRLFNRTNTVSIIYIQLRDPGKQVQFDQRVHRLWPDLLLSSTGGDCRAGSFVGRGGNDECPTDVGVGANPGNRCAPGGGLERSAGFNHDPCRIFGDQPVRRGRWSFFWVACSAGSRIALTSAGRDGWSGNPGPLGKGFHGCPTGRIDRRRLPGLAGIAPTAGRSPAL